MDTYNVDLAAARVPKAKRFRTWLVVFAIYALSYFAVGLALERLWPPHGARESLGEKAVIANLWAFMMSLTLSSVRRANYQILVDEETISTRYSNFNSLCARTVRRLEVRTILEEPSGLLVSRHNRFGAFFWGSIWIPKYLADYEYLKRLVYSWKPASPPL